jgi:hypothetical protein
VAASTSAAHNEGHWHTDVLEIPGCGDVEDFHRDFKVRRSRRAIYTCELVTSGDGVEDDTSHHVPMAFNPRAAKSDTGSV